MIKLSIKKNGEITESFLFETLEEANAWRFDKEKINAFGKPSFYEKITVCIKEEERSKIRVLIEPAKYDSYGNETTPAIYKTEEGSIIPAIYEEKLILISEYDVIIEDAGEEIKKEYINSEALRLLADTDWLIIREWDSGIICPQEIKDARAEARAKIEK